MEQFLMLETNSLDLKLSVCVWGAVVSSLISKALSSPYNFERKFPFLVFREAKLPTFYLYSFVFPFCFGG
jgi:hypothetical protein